MPPVVENLTATSDGIGSSSITLTWDAVGVADNYTVYKLEQSSGGLSGVISFDQINMGNSVPGVITIPNVSSGCRSEHARIQTVQVLSTINITIIELQQ